MRHVSVQQLSAFVDGALSGVSRELVTRHLATCGACRDRHQRWRESGETLQRALSWMPDERLLDDWSARIELAITAERKGLPVPGFSSALPPPVASVGPPASAPPAPAPTSRASSGHTPLPMARPARAAAPSRAPSGHTPLPMARPAQPFASAKPPAPAPVARAHVTPPPTTPPPAPPAQVVVQPTPLPPPPVYVQPPPPVQVHVPPPPPPPPVQVQVPPPPAPAPPVQVFVTPPAPPAPAPVVPAPAPIELEPLGAGLGRGGYHTERPMPPRRDDPETVWMLESERPSIARRVLVIAAVAIAAFLISPLLPEVIRITVPERWRPRMPRVEFVRRGGDVKPPEPARAEPVRLADRRPVEAAVVPPAPIPVPVDTARAETPKDTVVRLPEVAAVSEPVAQAPEPPPAPKPKPRRKAPERRVEPEPEPEPDGPLSPEQTVTIVPVRVQTTISLAPEKPRPPVPPPLPTDTTSDASWPLLCGIVLTSAGEPVEGARVDLAAPALSVRTDKRGRFCISCPPGMRVLRFEHELFQPVSRAVELTASSPETRIWLTTPR
jgi:anti-sigma factor RsiW